MISWIGGKSKISSWIIPFIPNDIETYVEPFAGAMWVYFKMELNNYKNLKTIVYNDINDYLVNLFMCCKDHENFHNFIKDVDSQDRDKFYNFQMNLNKHYPYNMPDFNNALKFSYIATQVFSGISPLSGKYIDLKGKYKSKFDTFKGKLIDDKYINKLNRMTNFENIDFQYVIEKYDNEKAYFYVDAPYYKIGEKYYSNQSFKLEDHERLANCLKNIKGKFSLSYYDFPDLSVWFPKDKFKWESKNFAKASMAKSGKEQTVGTELLIMNY